MPTSSVAEAAAVAAAAAAAVTTAPASCLYEWHNLTVSRTRKNQLLESSLPMRFVWLLSPPVSIRAFSLRRFRGASQFQSTDCQLEGLLIITGQ